MSFFSFGGGGEEGGLEGLGSTHPPTPTPPPPKVRPSGGGHAGLSPAHRLVAFVLKLFLVLDWGSHPDRTLSTSPEPELCHQGPNFILSLNSSKKYLPPNNRKLRL